MSRWQVPVVIGAVLVGTVVGLAADVGDTADAVVVPALVTLLLLTFLGVDLRALRALRGLRTSTRTAVASLVLNFVWAPALAGMLGWLLLSGHPDLRVGLVMLLVTPCTDWYLVFTASARGNVALGAALLPPNLVLQLVLLPVFVAGLAGAEGTVPLGDLAMGTLLVLGVPLIGSSLLRGATARSDGAERALRSLAQAEGLRLALLAVAVAALFAAHATTVIDHPGSFARLVLPLAVFFAGAYLVASVVSSWLRLQHTERVTLTMTTMARNSPVALAVAAAAFPDRPLVVVALVVGPLLELPVLALAASRLRRQP